MKVTLYTPEYGRDFEADAVFLPGSLAPFEVMPGHAPIISTLTAGIVRWRVLGREESLEIKGGVARVRGNAIQICVEI